MIFRVHYRQLGAHVHCRFFSAAAPGATFAKLGDFTVSAGEEFNQLRHAMKYVEFLPEEGAMAT